VTFGIGGNHLDSPNSKPVPQLKKERRTKSIEVWCTVTSARQDEEIELGDEKHRQWLEEPFAWQFPAQGQGVQAMSPYDSRCCRQSKPNASNWKNVSGLNSTRPLGGSAATARGFLGFPGPFPSPVNSASRIAFPTTVQQRRVCDGPPPLAPLFLRQSSAFPPAELV
jgi:hypothetical protein